MIVFIPRSGGGCKSGEYDSEWLPRQCPGCKHADVIGHGRRRRQAHDQMHDWISVRRGLCTHCHRCLTVLPCWCMPRALYSLKAREQAMTQLAAGKTLEEAAPQCRDPDRVADPSTIRRWVWRRVESLLLRLAAGATALLPPTILAWDFRAAAGILIPEPSPP
jgi:Domain of unknown function (DUF6431)